jgi:hypothetical protein
VGSQYRDLGWPSLFSKCQIEQAHPGSVRWVGKLYEPLPPPRVGHQDASAGFAKGGDAAVESQRLAYAGAQQARCRHPSGSSLLVLAFRAVSRRIFHVAGNRMRRALCFVQLSLSLQLFASSDLPTVSLIAPLAFLAAPLICSRSIFFSTITLLISRREQLRISEVPDIARRQSVRLSALLKCMRLQVR